MKRTVTAVIASSMLYACGDANNPQQSSEITLTAPLNASVGSTLTTGSIYYVVSTSNGGYRGTYQLGAGNSSVTATIPNGSYKLYAIGATAYSATAGSYPFTGFNPQYVYCGGGQSVSFDGNPVTVSTNLSSTECSSSTNFSGGDFVVTSGAIRPLTVKMCATSGFSTISTYSASCPTTYVDSATSSDSKVIQSIKIGYPVQGTNYTGTNSPAATDGIFSYCQNLSSNSASLNWRAYGNGSNSQNPASISIIGYSGVSCTSSSVRTWVFPSGFGSSGAVGSSGSAKAYAASSGGGATLFLDGQ